MRTLHFTAVIARGGDGFVSHCPQLDVASQGATVEEARANLAEAVEAFLASASPGEIAFETSTETYVTAISVDLP